MILFVFVASPEIIRSPRLEHLHLRMQLIVDGHAENFANANYQEQSPKDVCSDALPEHPIHFHDNKDQFVHIHWKNITGGMVMKYYGWNYIGGINSVLGYRLDTLPQMVAVPIHDDVFPKVKHGDAFFIYSGDQNGYTKRTFDDWRNLTLEKFFNKASNFPGAPTQAGESQEGRLARLNNLIGNVVIFVQKTPPTDQQIRDRFNRLAPLGESACAE